jgi:hypothetical protein
MRIDRNISGGRMYQHFRAIEKVGAGVPFCGVPLCGVAFCVER